MTPKNCKGDISAIEKQIDDFDNSIRDQILKKIEKVKENPEIGDKKKHSLGEPDYRVVKVNNQRIVIVYKFTANTPCIVTFIKIDGHDQAYRRTY